MSAAIKRTGTLTWVEIGTDPKQDHQTLMAQPEKWGDVVLARKDFPASYHLAVTVDDAIQGVTLVTRGEDLATATHIHRVLQALLALPTPRYRHHALLIDAAGRRLAKRKGAPTIGSMRQKGMTPGEVIAMAEAASPQPSARRGLG